METRNGVSVKPRGEGDSRFIVFHTAAEAVEATAEIQQEFADANWQLPRPLKVRASLHTGAADLQLGDYYGPAVNRAARIRGIAHGGQTVISGSTMELVQDRLPDGVTVRDMGEHSLKDLTRPEHIYQLDIEGLSNNFPPLTSLDSVANNLPRQLTEFIGRESELAEAKRLLAETRLLTILAPGGTGKTRLSIQAGPISSSNIQTVSSLSISPTSASVTRSCKRSQSRSALCSRPTMTNKLSCTDTCRTEPSY